MESTRKPIKKLYYSIGEVSKITELKQYVLRYWETEFTQLNPIKNKAGNRTYRQKDIDTILRIKDLLYNRKFTIEGARKQLIGHRTENGTDTEREMSEESPKEIKVTSGVDMEVLLKIRGELKSLLDSLED